MFFCVLNMLLSDGNNGRFMVFVLRFDGNKCCVGNNSCLLWVYLREKKIYLDVVSWCGLIYNCLIGWFVVFLKFRR